MSTKKNILLWISYHKLYYTVLCSWRWTKSWPKTCQANLDLSI